MPAADERIQLRNPDPAKKAPRIDKGTYAIVRKVSLATLPARGAGMTWTDFRDRVSARLLRTRGFDRAHNPWWYTHAVKLDLEAKGEIKRVGRSPQRLLRG